MAKDMAFKVVVSQRSQQRPGDHPEITGDHGDQRFITSDVLLKDWSGQQNGLADTGQLLTGSFNTDFRSNQLI